MAVDELIPLLLSAALLLASVITVAVLAKKPARTVSLQYEIFLAHRSQLVLSALLLLGTFAVNGTLGIVFIVTGRPLGWAFVLLAPVPLVVLAYLGSIAKRPFHPPTEPDTENPFCD